jgi:hypothetical protein
MRQTTNNQNEVPPIPYFLTQAAYKEQKQRNATMPDGVQSEKRNESHKRRVGNILALCVGGSQRARSIALKIARERFRIKPTRLREDM